MTKKQKKRFIEQTKDRLKRVLSGTLAMYMLFTSLFVVFPFSQSYALTGGPSQPEVQSFEPIGTSDMVDLFSGDFTYNIPLLDVEGYPINLAYHSGVTMDQEASWVGLGWNVNVGTINRALRGLPDDFNGDEVRTELNMKPNRTIGFDVKIGDTEIFGKKLSQFSPNMNLGVNINNYNGVGFDLSIRLKNFKFAKKLGLGLTGELGLNSSSSGGLSISPSINFAYKAKESEKRIQNLSGKVGASFNSRSGLSNLSIGANSTYKISAARKAKGKSQRGNMAAASFNFQQPTYTPSISQSMNSFAISGRTKAGFSFFGSDIGVGLNANFSTQKLAKNEDDKSVKSFGYLYSHNGQNNKDARHDYNRENSGSVTPATPNLSLANYTYDIYSVSGQGVGGSYRPYRGQIGHIYNNDAKSSSSSIPFTAEGGIGVSAHLGGRISVTVVNSKSGKWETSKPGFRGDNLADEALSFKNVSSANDFENVSFREANEMSVMTDEGLYNQFGTDEARMIRLEKQSNFNVDATASLISNVGSNNSTSITRNYQNERTKRNSTIQNLTIAQVKAGMGLVDFESLSYAQNLGEDHHLGQIISLGTDGMRYVYGQPAYNKTQQEVTFSVGQRTNGDSYIPGAVDYENGLVSYTGTANSIENDWGVDNYFQRVTTPAFAHSYLLNAVVSDDYVDVDGIKGPTDGDLGSWTKFNYDRVDDYKWRIPVQEYTASYNEGLKGDPQDDKASYLYGAKELFYLDDIETKNFIAKFETSEREDALGVEDDNGGVDPSKRMRKLDKISLFSKEDIRLNGTNATPLKEVHFVYDYELCPGISNSVNGGGKLTLKKVYFTYRDSQKGKLSPYSFTYDNNYSYNLKAYDRWGCYKPMDASVDNGYYNEAEMPTFEFPYVEQDQVSANDYTSAWTMTEVGLPSGGSIGVGYESDDYAYVQNKKAMSMFKIVNVGQNNPVDPINNPLGEQSPDGFDYNGNPGVKPVSDVSLNPRSHRNRRIYFERDPTRSIEEHVEGIDDLYFRCLMEFDNPEASFLSGRYDYVSGYAKIAGYGLDPNDSSLGYLELEPVSFNDKDIAENKNPIALAGIQFGRLHLSKYVWDSPIFNENQVFGAPIITAAFQTLANFIEGFKNPNQTIYDKNRGTKIVLNKSWIRLNTVSKKKLGGGCRVANIRMFDNWDSMTNSAMDDADYGQDYDYTLEDGKSSGVASYEPQMGGDENPHKTPIRFADKKRWAPDERFYQENPIGESFFPSASVGYSQVRVTNKKHGVDANNNNIIDPIERSVKRSATGAVVHQFYTAKEYPTIVKKTDIDPIRHKTKPFGLSSIFKINNRDFYTGSQGFTIVTNDMHGKPKAQMVFQEDQNNPITKVEYIYKDKQIGNNPNTRELINQVSTISQNGESHMRTIGVNFDAIADFQESTTKVYSAGVDPNVDAFPIAFIPIPIPTIWPSVSSDKTMFRSATLTKVVQKFGVLENTVATDLGSVVETKNLAYDAETGQVLLTETATNYEDKVYSMSYPAYWHYDNMGQAYKNIGYSHIGNINSGLLNLPSDHKFVVGDELQIATLSPGIPVPTNIEKAWVTSISGNMAKIELASGMSPLNNSYQLVVIRSGRRNMQSQMMASITTLTNPMTSFQNNIYENVLQASAIEFSDKWRTYCDCDGSVATASTNPYFLGTRGNFKPIVSYLHLSDRTQSDFNNNTDIRRDGVFESYRPYYKLLANGEWQVDRKDWTYTAEVTEFNPFGQELENQDALGRYSSATFGFNQTLAKAVAANARYRDIGFTSFEDDDFSDCADNHFKFDEVGVERESEDAHSGIYSVRVNAGSSATIKRDLAWCDQSGCTLELGFDDNSGTTVSLDVIGNDGEVRIQYDIISGSPTIVPTASGPQVLLQGDFDIEFNLIDDEGCQVSEHLIVVNGVVTP